MKKTKTLKRNGYLYYFIIGAVILILLILLLVFKKGTFSLDDVNRIVITCPESVSPGSQFECDITMFYDTSAYAKVASVNAEYNLPDGVNYVSFNVNCEDCEIAEHSENGFALALLAGFNNNYNIGKLKLAVSDTAENNEQYTVGLTEAAYSYELPNDEEVYSLDLADSSTIVTVTAEVTPYEFSSTRYLYNSELNYLYVKNDTDSTLLNNLDELPSGFSYNINNDKLEVHDETEAIVANIQILRFATGDYTITDNQIYIGNAITVANLLEQVTSTTLSLKVVDNSNEEKANDSLLVNGDKLNVYYQETLLDNYSLVVDTLSIDYDYVDSTNNIIYLIPVNTPFESIVTKITTSGAIKRYDALGNEKSNEDIIKTNDTIVIQKSDNNITYVMSVFGDLNGTGNVDIGDVALLYQVKKGNIPITNLYNYTGDMNGTGSIDIGDVAKLYQIKKGNVR